MELFSVACITCRAKLKVRQVSAIGQILPCPRCGGMVQIAPPPGWKPPPDATAPATTSAAARPSPEVSDRGVSAATPTSDAAPSWNEADVYTPMLADDALSRMPSAVSPRERAVRRVVVIVSAIAAVLIIAIGIWTGFGSDSAEPGDGDAIAAATGSATARVSATASGSSRATSSNASGNATPTAVASASSAPTAAALASAMPSSTLPPSATASSTAAPPIAMATPVPTATAAPLATASAVSPAVAAATPASSSPPKIPAPPMPAPPVDLAAVQAKLKATIPAVEFAQTPLRRALDAVGEIGGLHVQYDWSTIAAPHTSLNAPVTLSVESAPVGDVLAKLTAPLGLQCVVRNGRIQVAGPTQSEDLKAVDYPIDDLTDGDVSRAETLAKLVRLFVEPTAWDIAGGRGSAAAAARALTISQTAHLQTEAAAFLDRLRLARGKPVRHAAAGAAPSLDSRLTRAKSQLEKTLKMNFRPGVPLRTILDRIETGCGLTIVVDYAALELSGTPPDGPIGIAAADNAVFEVLDALCEPRGWTWHLPADGVIELSTPETLGHHAYVEFYDVSRLITGDVTAAHVVDRVRGEIAGMVQPFGSEGGELAYDGVSGRLIVRHHHAAQLAISRLLVELAEPQAPKPGTAAPVAVAPRPTATATTTPAAAMPRHGVDPVNARSTTGGDRP